MADKELSVTIRARDNASGIFNKIASDVNKLSVSFDNVEKEFKGFKKVADSFISAGTKMFFSGGSIVAGLTLAAKKASDFVEVQDKFSNVFSASANQAEQFSNALVEGFGMSEKQAKTFLSTIQGVLLGVGASAPEAANLSNEFVKLASDMANFNNVGVEEVLSAFQRAIAGSSKSLKEYGIVIDENDIRQEAFNRGLIKSGEKMSETAKSTALLQLILSKVPQVIGQTQREFNGLDSQLERLRNRMDDFSTKIGLSLVPVFENILMKIEPLINGIIRFTNENKELVSGFAEMALKAGIFLTGLGVLNIAIGTILKSVSGLKKGFEVIKIFASSPYLRVIPVIIDELAGKFKYLGFALNAVPFVAAAAAGYKYLKVIKETSQALSENADSTDSLSNQESKLSARAMQAAKDTGLKIKNWDQLVKLQKEGLIAYDREAGVFKKVSQEIQNQNSSMGKHSSIVSIAGSAYKKLKDEAIKSLDEVDKKIKDLDKTINSSDFEKAQIADKYGQKLNEIKRQAQTDSGDMLGAWKAQLGDASKASDEAAKLIQQASTTLDETVRKNLIDLAKSKIESAGSLSSGLTDAVKKTNDAGQEIVLQTSKQSQDQVKSLLETLQGLEIRIVDINTQFAKNEKSGLVKQAEDLQKVISSIPENIDVKLKFEIDQASLDSAQKAIKSVSKNFRLDITAAPEEQNEPGFARGGSLPGYGGGDKIRALLEAGEFVVRKEAVKKFGSGLFHALNSLNIPDSFGKVVKARFGGLIPDLNIPLPVPAFQAGGMVSGLNMKSFGTMDLNLNGKSFPIMGAIDVIGTLKTELMREKLRRSQ